MNSLIMSSEAVTEGNLNKICDLIADLILNSYLEKDENSIVLVDVIINDKFLFVIGSIYSKVTIDVKNIIKEHENLIINNQKINELEIILNIDYYENNNEIIFHNFEQGLIFGYACNETLEFMPYSVIYSQRLARMLFNYMIKNKNKFANYDGKVQINVEYKNNKLYRIDSIIIYINYLKNKLNEIEKNMIIENIKKIMNEKLIDINTRIMINSTTQNIIYNECISTGISGRNNFNNLYGGYSRYVSCSLCGRNPIKIEKSATYMSRFIAKNLVATGLINKVEIGLNYEFGSLEPNSIIVNSYGQKFDSGMITSDDIIIMIKKIFPLNIKEIIKLFDLNNVKYLKNTNYGYFENENSPWDQLNYVKKIKSYFTKEKGIIFLD